MLAAETIDADQSNTAIDVPIIEQVPALELIVRRDAKLVLMSLPAEHHAVTSLELIAAYRPLLLSPVAQRGDAARSPAHIQQAAWKLSHESLLTSAMTIARSLGMNEAEAKRHQPAPAQTTRVHTRSLTEDAAQWISLLHSASADLAYTQQPGHVEGIPPIRYLEGTLKIRSERETPDAVEPPASEETVLRSAGQALLSFRLAAAQLQRKVLREIKESAPALTAEKLAQVMRENAADKLEDTKLQIRKAWTDLLATYGVNAEQHHIFNFLEATFEAEVSWYEFALSSIADLAHSVANSAEPSAEPEFKMQGRAARELLSQLQLLRPEVPADDAASGLLSLKLTPDGINKILVLLRVMVTSRMPRTRENTTSASMRHSLATVPFVTRMFAYVQQLSKASGADQAESIKEFVALSKAFLPGGTDRSGVGSQICLLISLLINGFAKEKAGAAPAGP